MQLILIKSDPSNVNLKTLNKEPKGAIEIILNQEGKLEGVTQKGETVSVTVMAASTPSSEFTVGDAEKLIKVKGDALKTEIEKSVSEAFTSQLKVLQDEITALKTKAAPKAAAPKKDAPKNDAPKKKVAKGKDGGK